MTLTQKEHALLKDAKGQEELCIAKYQKYSEMAKASELKALFSSMAQADEAVILQYCGPIPFSALQISTQIFLSWSLRLSVIQTPGLTVSKH